jgi:hypothetical protein
MAKAADFYLHDRREGEKTNFKGLATESWHCIDCKVNTNPGALGRVELEEAFKKGQKPKYRFDEQNEAYFVRSKVGKKAGMLLGWDTGCLCIGCLEKRLGRRLRLRDFDPGHPFNRMPGAPRLMRRRGDYRPMFELVEIDDRVRRLTRDGWSRRGDVAGHSLPRRQLGGMRGQRTETAPATRMDHSAARQRRDVAGGGGNG